MVPQPPQPFGIAPCQPNCLSVQNLDITDGSSKVSETFYIADQELLDLLLDAYGVFKHRILCTLQIHPLQQLEFDVIAMTAYMLGGMLTAAQRMQSSHIAEFCSTCQHVISLSCSTSFYFLKCLLVLLPHALRDPPDEMQCFPQTHVACTFTNMHEKH